MSTIRINNPTSLDKPAIAADLVAGKEVIIQFTQAPGTALLAEINTLCHIHNDQLTIRFYSSDLDCAILRHIPQVKSLAVNCIMRAENTDNIKALEHLIRLDFGVYEFKETDFLAADQFKNLTKLSLGESKTKGLNLAHLQQCTQLNWLFIEGHTKNIEAISTLNHLNYCRLHGLTKTRLDFINPLKQLKTLELTLGGRENLDEIEKNNIENLIIGRVRGFSHLGNIAHFKALKYLSITEQIQMQTLAFEGDFTNLLALNLHDCKTLNNLTGLSHLSALQHLRIWHTDIAFESLLTNKLPNSLKQFSFAELKNKNNPSIKDKLLAMGYAEATWFNLPQSINKLN